MRGLHPCAEKADAARWMRVGASGGGIFGQKKPIVKVNRAPLERGTGCGADGRVRRSESFLCVRGAHRMSGVDAFPSFDQKYHGGEADRPRGLASYPLATSSTIFPI